MSSPLGPWDSKAAASVQLADDAVDVAELQPELARVDMVRQRPPVGLKLQLLHDFHAAIAHRVTDRRAGAVHDDVHRADRVAERAAEMIGPDLLHGPGALAVRLTFLVHLVDEDELALLVVTAETVDDQL